MILHCMKRLASVDATLQDATEFYMRHGASKINPTLANAVEDLLERKRQLNRNELYLQTLHRHLYKFVGEFGFNTHIAEITNEQIFDYIYIKHNHLNGITQKNIIRSLSVLFNYAVTKNMLGMSPLENLDEPKVYQEKPAVITPEEFATLLNRCYRKKWHDRLAIFVLVGFCGIRREEACKMTWQDIKWDEGTVEVPARIAKGASYREHKLLRESFVMSRRV